MCAKTVLTSGLGGGQRAGHRQEEEDRQLHDVFLVRLRAAASSRYQRLLHQRGLLYTHAEISISCARCHEKRALCCSCRDGTWCEGACGRCPSSEHGRGHDEQEEEW